MHAYFPIRARHMDGTEYITFVLGFKRKRPVHAVLVILELSLERGILTVTRVDYMHQAWVRVPGFLRRKVLACNPGVLYGYIIILHVYGEFGNRHLLVIVHVPVLLGEGGPGLVVVFPVIIGFKGRCRFIKM